MEYDKKQLAENRRKATKTAAGLFVMCLLLLVMFVVIVWFRAN